MELTYLVLTLIIAFLAVIHSFITYPLSLALMKTISGTEEVRKNLIAGNYPSVAICVCAYNEASGIETKLANLRELCQNYPGDASIHVYDDCSSDGTADLIIGGDGVTAIRGHKRAGKSTGMNTLLSDCNQDLIVFTDANVKVKSDALSVFAAYFHDATVGCVCGTLLYLDSDSAVAAQTSSLYWKLEEYIKQLESDTGSVMGADGSLFAIRGSLFRPVPADIIDDMFTSISILCDGFKVKRAPEAIAYERAAQTSHDEFRRKKRITCRSVNCTRLLWKRLCKLNVLDIYKFTSHKLLRWSSIFWIMLFAATAFALIVQVSGVIDAVTATAVTCLLLLLAHVFQLPIGRHVTEMLLSFTSVGIGVVQSFLGMRYQTWQPVVSAHDKPVA